MATELTNFFLLNLRYPFAAAFKIVGVPGFLFFWNRSAWDRMATGRYQLAAILEKLPKRNLGWMGYTKRQKSNVYLINIAASCMDTYTEALQVRELEQQQQHPVSCID